MRKQFLKTDHLGSNINLDHEEIKFHNTFCNEMNAIEKAANVFVAQLFVSEFEHFNI